MYGGHCPLPAGQFVSFSRVGRVANASGISIRVGQRSQESTDKYCCSSACISSLILNSLHYRWVLRDCCVQTQTQTDGSGSARLVALQPVASSHGTVQQCQCQRQKESTMKVFVAVVVVALICAANGNYKYFIYETKYYFLQIISCGVRRLEAGR